MLEGIGGNIENYMTMLSASQKVTASNIANVDTPGYRAKEVDFGSMLDASMSTPPRIVNATGLREKSDGNNVDLDHEARMLAENALRFNVASNLLRSELQGIKSALQDGSQSS